jgi:hypothetical protein
MPKPGDKTALVTGDPRLSDGAAGSGVARLSLAADLAAVLGCAKRQSPPAQDLGI